MKYDYMKVYREGNIINGKCTSHPRRDAVEGKTVCTECLKLKKEQSKKQREIARINKKCLNHPNEDAMLGKKHCQECLDSALKKSQYYISKGICPSHPNSKLVEGKTMCQKCLDDKLNIYKKLKEEGICVCCRKEQAIINRTRCKNCLWLATIKRVNLSDLVATQLLEKQNYICPLSGIKLIKGINASPDHILHKSNGGNNEIDNIRFLDISINKMRNIHTDQELIELCKKVVEYNE